MAASRLGSAKTVSSIFLQHAEAGGENTAWNTNDFNLKVSTDSTNWTTVANITGNISNVTTHNFTAISGRYILLSIITGSNGAARIYEFEVYGSGAMATNTPVGPTATRTNTHAGCGTSNAALNKPAMASSLRRLARKPTWPCMATPPHAVPN